MCVTDCVCAYLGYLCVCVCVVFDVSWWLLLFAVLGNHKTQSFWSIPEPLPLYIAFSLSTHKPSTFLSLSLIHTLILSFFPSIFHLSSALPLLISVLHLLLPHSLYLCVLLCFAALCCVSPGSGHFSCHRSFPPVPSTAAPEPHAHPTANAPPTTHPFCPVSP